jgi:hypothetical protein
MYIWECLSRGFILYASSALPAPGKVTQSRRPFYRSASEVWNLRCQQRHDVCPCGMVTRTVMLRNLAKIYHFEGTYSCLTRRRTPNQRLLSKRRYYLPNYTTPHLRTQQLRLQFRVNIIYNRVTSVNSERCRPRSSEGEQPWHRVTAITGHHAIIQTVTQRVGTASYFCVTNKHSLHSRTLS